METNSKSAGKGAFEQYLARRMGLWVGRYQARSIFVTGKQ